jgi:hypothetical protein
MSKILRRPMFRGGPVSSYGNGIATGLANGGRVGYQVGGPIYPAGYSAVPKSNMTGADIKRMAEEQVFGAPFKKDLATGILKGGDILENYLFQPLITGGDKLQDYFTGSKYGKDKKFIGDVDEYQKMYDEKVMPVATKLSEQLIPQVSSEDEYEEAEMGTETYFDEDGKLQFRPSNEVELRNEARKKSYIDNAISTDREQAIMDKDYSEMKKVLDKQRADPNEGRGGGFDASQDDFEIPVGVTEIPGEKTDETTDGGAIGYKELADSFFEQMSEGSDARLAERLAAADERSAGRLKKARIEDLSDIGLDIFRRTVGEGKDIKQALGESAGRMIDKPSRSEKERDRGDIRRERLEDAAANREEGRFDAATQMAFKQMMTEKGFDFKDLQSEKSINAAMERLKLQLETTKDVAQQKIIAQRLRDLEQIKAKVFAPGNTEKDITWAMKQSKDSAEYQSWLNKNNYAPTLESHVKNRASSLEGRPMSNSEINALGPLYYSDWGGTFIQGGDQKDGTYLDTKANEIITIRNGEVVEELTESLTVN